MAQEHVRVEAVVGRQRARERLVHSGEERVVRGEEAGAARGREVLELRVAVVPPGVRRARRGRLERQLEVGGDEVRDGRSRERGDAEERQHCGLVSQTRRSEEHTSELQSLTNLVCRLLLEKK